MLEISDGAHTEILTRGASESVTAESWKQMQTLHGNVYQLSCNSYKDQVISICSSLFQEVIVKGNEKVR